MKKQYIFLSLIFITLYIFYLIGNYKYKEYKINSTIEYLANENEKIAEKIEIAESIIEYKTTKAYRNKVLKEQQWLKNKWEKVVYLTTEQTFNKYAQKWLNTWEEEKKEEDIYVSWEDSLIKNMTIYEKWIYFLFEKKDT